MKTAAEPAQIEKTPTARQASGLTPRALILGVLLTVLVDFWIH